MNFFCGEALFAAGLACSPHPNPTAFDTFEHQLAAQHHVIAGCTDVNVETRMWHTLPKANEHSGTIYRTPFTMIEGISKEGIRFKFRHSVGYDSVNRWSVTEERRGEGERELVLHGKNPETETIAEKSFVSYSSAPDGLLTDLRDPKGQSLCSTAQR